MDRAEEERGVLLVDQHRQAAVGRAAGRAPLHAQVGRVAVVSVGDEGLARGQRLVDARRGARGSRIAQTRCRCSFRSTKSSTGGSASTRVHDRPDLGRRTVHEQDRCRVERQLGHPVGELVGLHGVDPLVREDGPVLGAAGPVRDVERADQAAHGEAARGVLVQVERGLVVAAELSAFLPLRQPGGDGPVRSGEEAPRGRVADAAGVQPDPVERRQAQRSPHIRGDDHGTGVHRPSVVLTR